MNGTACSFPAGTAGGNHAQAQCRAERNAAPDRGDRPPRSLNVEFRENTPEEFRAFVAAEMEKWGKVVREANIKLG